MDQLWNEWETLQSATDYSQLSTKEIESMKTSQINTNLDRIIRHLKIKNDQFDAREYLRAYLKGEERFLLTNM